MLYKSILSKFYVLYSKSEKRALSPQNWPWILKDQPYLKATQKILSNSNGKWALIVSGVSYNQGS